MQVMSFNIRPAREGDAAAVLAIYAPIVRETAISFEYGPLSVKDMQERIREISKTHPFLVAELDRKVVGYAYATAHRKREAYRWACETSVFVDTAHRRKGAARALYTALIRILRLQGFCQAFAIITLPNPPSIAFHESLGFEHVASFEDIGFKLGFWRDTGWWRLKLLERPSRPAPPRAPPEVWGTAHLAKALGARDRAP
jgi:phosphinothricin acetyltransferase